MYELTESQALEIGGGLDGVPYGHGSQRLILPEWEMDRPLEPVEFPEPPMPFPNFGG